MRGVGTNLCTWLLTSLYSKQRGRLNNTELEDEDDAEEEDEKGGKGENGDDADKDNHEMLQTE